MLQASPVSGTSQWHDLPVGGGGAQTKLRISSNGYIFSGGNTTSGGGVSGGSTVVGSYNRPLATPSSCPSAYRGTPYLGGSCYALEIDPNNDNILYWYHSPRNFLTHLTNLWKSTNKGVTWSLTGFPTINADANEQNAGNKNRQIAVDPANSNVIYAGGPFNLRRSLNGGATASTVTAVPNATSTVTGVNAILFDPTSGTVTLSGQPVTKRIYVSSTGNGVFHSEDGGATWALLASSPKDAGKGYMGSDGTAYFIGLSGSGITRVNPETLAVSSIPGTANAVSLAIDPGDPSHGWTVIPGWSFYAFTGALNGVTAPSLTSQSTGPNPVIAVQCPWNAATDLYVIEMVWDPLVATSTTSATIGMGAKTFTVGAGLNLVVGDAVRARCTESNANYMLGTVTRYSGTTLTLAIGSLSEGSGVYLGASTGESGTFSAWTITKERCWLVQGSGLAWLDAPPFGAQVVVNDQSWGIESLSGNAVLWPPNHNLVLISSDFPFHAVTTSPIGTTGIPRANYSNPAGGIADGTQACWAWNAPGAIFTASVGFTGASTDGGKTWTAFASNPARLPFSYIAAATTSNIVICNWNGSPCVTYYTTDGGASWGTASGAPTSVPGFPYQNFTHPLCVDDSGNYYIVSGGYVYKSADGGANWTQGTNGLRSSSKTPQFRSVPGSPGHLLLSDGPQFTGPGTLAGVASSHPVNGHPLRFSPDGGNTWRTFPNTGEVLCVSVGAAKPGGNGYPSIFMIGWVSSVFGIWRADNFNAASVSSTTWTFTGDYVADRSDLPCDIAGCMDIWDWCAVAYSNGAGWTFRGAAGSWP